MEPPAKLMSLAELDRGLANVVRYGAIHDVDHDRALARVAWATGKDGNPVLTGWLPFATVMAGADRDWRPPSPGEQAILLAPSGELAAAVILAGVYTREFPAPDASPHKHVALYRDGARIEYDSEEHVLSAALPGGDAAVAIAPDQLTLERGACSLLMTDDGITLQAPVIQFVGTAAFAGSVTVSEGIAIQGGDVEHAGRGIGKSHTHGGVQPGSAVTGPPA